MSLDCYHCGAEIERAALPFGRLEACRSCGKYLHVCRMCGSFDPREATKQCTEEDAEEVHDKVGSNFCEYFTVKENAFVPVARDETADAELKLRALFGEPARDDSEHTPGESADSTLEDAEALFRK
jgi:hypothetical protein